MERGWVGGEKYLEEWVYEGGSEGWIKKGRKKREMMMKETKGEKCSEREIKCDEIKEKEEMKKMEEKGRQGGITR